MNELQKRHIEDRLEICFMNFKAGWGKHELLDNLRSICRLLDRLCANEIEDVDGEKYFAMHVLAEAWAGAVLPESIIEEAEQIRNSLIAKNKWEKA